MQQAGLSHHDLVDEQESAHTMAQAPTPKAPRRSPEFETGLRVGKQQGRQEVRQEILDFLENEYMNREMATDEPKARAILELTAAISAKMKVNEAHAQR